jgi:hypothetical protein
MSPKILRELQETPEKSRPLASKGQGEYRYQSVSVKV